MCVVFMMDHGRLSYFNQSEVGKPCFLASDWSNLRTFPDNNVLYKMFCLLGNELGFYATLASELDSVVEYKVESEIIHFSKFKRDAHTHLIKIRKQLNVTSRRCTPIIFTCRNIAQKRSIIT